MFLLSTFVVNIKDRKHMSKYGIEHVVVLMLENRSFDHLFGYLDHPKTFNGLTGNEWNPISSTDHTKVFAIKGAKPYIFPDPSHEHTDVLKQQSFQGYPKFSNKGFYDNFNNKGKNYKRKLFESHKTISDPKEIMACWDPSDSHIKNLTYLAKNYVLCDNWFCSIPGETWPNRNYIHAATSASQVNIKTKFYTSRTIYDELKDKGLTWNIYHDGIAQSMAFIKLHLLQNGGFTDFDNFKKDVKNNNLPNYSFIEPRHFNLLKGYSNSMHPSNNGVDGSTDLKGADNLVGEIYNTLISNEAVWQKSLLIITFDEHGGFFDHAKTRSSYNPGNEIDKEFGFRFNFLGVRVPAILISPKFYLQSIDSTPYDHTSVIRSVFDNFEITKFLTNRDKNANTFWHNLKSKTTKKSMKKLTLHPLKNSKMKSFAATQEILSGFQKDLIQLAENIEQLASEPLPNTKDIKALKQNKWNQRFMFNEGTISSKRLLELTNNVNKIVQK